MAVNNQHEEKCNQSSNCQLPPWINILFRRKGKKLFFFFVSALPQQTRDRP